MADEKRKVSVRTIRAFLLRRRIPIIGITGTSGKTTTKEMVTSILRGRYNRVLKTLGNANKREHTKELLEERLGSGVRALVLEMGMDGRGQIAAHCRLTPPNIGVITNVNRGHVGKCGGFLGVVKAKNELVYGMRRRGVVILNTDDEGTKLLNLSRFLGRIVWFGRAENADVRLLNSERHGLGFKFTVFVEGRERQFYIRTLGEHNIYNALAAIAVGRVLRISWSRIRRGLRLFRRAPGRLALRRGVKGSYVIDDTFNANPLSVKAGLKALDESSQGRKTIAVLGLMGEQGRRRGAVHRQVGEEAARLNIDELVTVGGRVPKAIADGAIKAGMPKERTRSFRTRSAAIRYLRSRLGSDCVALVKGSHSTKLYRVARALVRRTRKRRGSRR